ncbi:MAG: hypothetical protein LGB58_02715, partial [Sulfurovum sp.]|nr:hypothetical protein [Sulfurovum sp.]
CSALRSDIEMYIQEKKQKKQKEQKEKQDNSEQDSSKKHNRGQYAPPPSPPNHYNRGQSNPVPVQYSPNSTGVINNSN